MTANVRGASIGIDVSMPPLWGLVLAGGRSRRLGRDKARVDYHGLPQLRWAYERLAECCAEVRVSVRDLDAAAPFRALGLIADSGRLEGPAAGLASASRAHPDVAWLVLAVDMPLIDLAMLDALVAARDPRGLATVFVHADGTPEPLCAIWEPAVATELAAAGHASLRRLLEGAAHRAIVPATPARLMSVNSPADERAARAWLRQASEPRHGT